MKSTVTDALGELFDYLEKYNLTKVLAKKELQQHLKSAFKKYYALLILENEISSHRQWPKRKEKSAQYSRYMTEATSDICQSLILAMQGMYKPAYLVLRSGVENFFRCIGIGQDQNVTSVTSVYDLIEIIKDTDLMKTNNVARSRFLKLKGRYSELCDYVHTSSSHHMAMTKLVGVFPRFVEIQAAEYFKCLGDVVTDICCLNAIILKASFVKLHHKHRDIIYDAMPLAVKRHLAED